MNMNAKLSVSSVILAAVLSGCSQQQVIGGSQVVNGSSQQVAGGSQVSGSSQQGGSQQQVEAVAPVVMQPKVAKRAPIRVYRKAEPVKRVYTRGPKPTRSIKRSGLGLPAAKPGQCFAKIKINASYKTQSRRILVSKATSKRVLVRAPQHRFINKKVQVRKAYYKTRTIPAQYRTTNKRVLVKPAYNTWKKGYGAITRIDNMTGEIMCRVKVPAVYKNVSRRVLARPAQNIRTFVPAVYKTVKQKKFIAPALYKTIRTPARYKTQNYRVKTGGARYAWRAVLCKTNAPKNYRKAVTKRKPVVRTSSYKKQYNKSSGISYQDYMRVMNAGTGKAKLNKAKKVSKRAVLKKKTQKVMAPKPKMTAPKPKMTAPKAVTKAAVKTTPKQAKSAAKQSIVYGIQKALKNKGFDPGTIDGKMGPGTAAALKAFQSSRGLPVGQLSKDTFRALGLIR
jgi:hypothetical protein